MPRFRSIAIAFAALGLSAGSALAFTALPDAASGGLDKATQASGKTVPARPANPAGPPADEAPAPDAEELEVAPAELPDAAQHGADVSAAANADDLTPETNRGADVSAVAKDNHGQATAAEHKPADAGPPADAGKPDGAGKPEGAGQPEDPGQPETPAPRTAQGSPSRNPPLPRPGVIQSDAGASLCRSQTVSD